MAIRRVTKREGIKTKIAALVRASGLGPDERIQSTNQLARRFRTTPLTIHRAVNELVADGLLYRVKGRGTFVAREHRKDGRNLCLVFPEPNIDSPIRNPENWHMVQRVFHALVEAAGADGTLTIAIAPPSNDVGKTAGKIREFDAAFFMADPRYAKTADSLGRMGLPVVMLNLDADGINCLNIVCDRTASVRLAVRSMIESGTERIAFVGGPSRSSVEKFAGYAKAHEESGSVPDRRLILRKIESQSDGPLAAGLLIASGAFFDGVFVDTDRKAAGLIGALNARGIRVPEDVRVMGYDALPEYVEAPPFLTSVRTPFVTMIETALAEIRNRKSPADLVKKIVVTGEVIAGKTCPLKCRKEQA